MTSPPEPLVQLQNNFKEMCLIMPSTKIDQNFKLAQLNNMATRAKNMNIFKWPDRPIQHLMCHDPGERFRVLGPFCYEVCIDCCMYLGGPLVRIEMLFSISIPENRKDYRP